MPTNTTSDILLVYPPITTEERYGSSLGAAGGRQIPLGIYYLASALREAGLSVQVIDAEARGLTVTDILRHLEKHPASAVGISTTTVAFHRALELARAIKQHNPGLTTIIGGPHVSSQPRHALAFPAFDFAVQHEGEVTLVELLNALAGKQPIKDIQGVIYRDNGEVRVNPPREYIDPVDRIPLPAYDLIPDFNLYAPPPCNYRKKPVVNIITSRGCPFACTFCANDTFGQKLRLRSAEDVVREIDILVNQRGVREIAFVDDTFTCNPDHVTGIFDLLDARGLSFPWTCMARVNTVTGPLLEYMKAHGCWHISFGIESGDPRILREIRKAIDLDQARTAVSACRRAGILTKGFFIVGHPLETEESIDATIKLALELPLDDVVVTLNTPIPGSEQYANVDKYGTLDKSDWADFNCWKPVFVPHGLTRDLLLAKHKEFYRRFYLRPRILWRYLRSFFGPTGWQRMLSVLRAAVFLLPIPGRKRRAPC